jgi:hypothetical protein
MGIRHTGKLQTALDAMEELDDAGIHALIARAQGLLLDRPVPPNAMPLLTVEVVERREGDLLACYRALAPFAQRRVQRYVLRLLRASQRLGERSRPIAQRPAHVGATSSPGGPGLHGRGLRARRWSAS